MKQITPLAEGLSEEEYAAILADYQKFDDDTLMAAMNMSVDTLGYDFLTGSVPVEGNKQPAGLFHGGAHVALAETLASQHSFMRAGTNVVGVDLNATHLKAARSGRVWGRAEVIHAGRTIINHEVRMTDDNGKLLSIVRITNLVLQPQA